MIKKILLALVIAFPTMAFAQKFGVITTDQLIQSLPEMKEVQTTLEASSKKYEDEFKNLQDEMQKKYTEFQNLTKDTTTPESIKERRMQELSELDQKVQQFRATATNDLQRQQQTLMAPIQEKILTAIKAVGQENNFTFIFTNEVPAYVGTDVVDVTPLVKTKLNVK